VQIRKAIFLSFVVLGSVNLSRGSQTPSSVAEGFCKLELEGLGLDGRQSRALWQLTFGEEEPFMAGDEIASECKVLRIETGPSSSRAVATVQYHVTGKIVESADGSKRILGLNDDENVRLRLSLVGGQWKISRKSLMYVPEHATAGAWAEHFERLVESDPAKGTHRTIWSR